MTDHASDARAQSAPKVVVVTGASAGVGRAVALAFARRGARIGLLARSADALTATKADVEAAGGTAIALPCDTADASQVFAAARHVHEEWGAIDVWVNNAMASIFAPVDRITPEEFRRVTEVTYLGYVHGTMAALAAMKLNNRGTIVQVGSALSYRAIPLQAPYCGAKFAIRGFTDALRSELIHDASRIRLTMVQLPAVNTPQFDWTRNKMGFKAKPLGRIYQPDAIASEIVRAADEAPRELWIGRSSIQAIVGAMLFPATLDRWLARTAYSGQFTSTPLPAGYEDNLFHSPAVGHKAHGRFDAEAVPTTKAATPKTVGAVAAALVVVGVLALLLV